MQPERKARAQSVGGERKEEAERKESGSRRGGESC